MFVEIDWLLVVLYFLVFFAKNKLKKLFFCFGFEENENLNEINDNLQGVYIVKNNFINFEARKKGRKANKRPAAGNNVKKVIFVELLNVLLLNLNIFYKIVSSEKIILVEFFQEIILLLSSVVINILLNDIIYWSLI